MITNEEKKVGLYTFDECPTNPVEVTALTPAESLNLNWGEKDLPERIRTKHVHRLHPYLGKYIPQLVEVFLRKYFVRGQTVIDPFCGSGTTLVQANELGINAVGYDISAFNVLLSGAKTDNYDTSVMRREVLDILEKVSVATQTELGQQTLWKECERTPFLSVEDDEYLNMWFAPQALRELLTYRYFIESGDYQYKELLKVILSRSARSARLTTHFDLDFPKKPVTEPYHCYKHNRTCYPTQVAFKFLKRYSNDTIRRVTEYSDLKTDASVEIHHEDCLYADFPKSNGVITSPPYVGLIDYHEQHAYAYHLLGLEDKREKEIGPAAGGKSKKAKENYQKNIAEVFRRTIKSMEPEGRLIVVANDKDNLYDGIADSLDVEVEDIIQRHVNRRTGRRAGQFYESIFVWRKI
ncbi:site-specific DNA-methyltransferase [Methanoplanus endosymbiosus]|uniref:Site-specific DNA-methyltransferase n=1 Tax=Methanoplanus endosymbiosus TaxID=33865 RepID=A0A9E7TKS9_9EURY|nr:site-specific DNA-methyltransferase [Methanoplanus endosymbiosus]UUX91546.1 site-specific DNA-methyltransferase [Methanoplanus endosymbiosus]